MTADSFAIWRRLAEAIAADLFVNGAGDQADRLVLTVDGPPKRDLGGWSRAPAIDRIEDRLRACAAEFALKGAAEYPNKADTKAPEPSDEATPSTQSVSALRACAEAPAPTKPREQILLTALKRVTADMDRAGGDGYGMPECPWCRCQYEGEIQHLPDCELALARQVIADIEAGLGAEALAPSPEKGPFDFVKRLQTAQDRVRNSSLYRRFIDGTPLENDIAVWMTEFAAESVYWVRDAWQLADRKQSEMFEQLEACRAALRGDDVSASIHPLVHEIAKLRTEALAPPASDWQLSVADRHIIACALLDYSKGVTDPEPSPVKLTKHMEQARELYDRIIAAAALPAPPRADARDRKEEKDASRAPEGDPA